MDKLIKAIAAGQAAQKAEQIALSDARIFEDEERRIAYDSSYAIAIAKIRACGGRLIYDAITNAVRCNKKYHVFTNESLAFANAVSDECPGVYATYTSGGDNIDINTPDFWQQVIITWHASDE